jgi:hypothetical protein
VRVRSGALHMSSNGTGNGLGFWNEERKSAFFHFRVKSHGKPTSGASAVTAEIPRHASPQPAPVEKMYAVGYSYLSKALIAQRRCVLLDVASVVEFVVVAMNLHTALGLDFSQDEEVWTLAWSNALQLIRTRQCDKLSALDRDVLFCETVATTLFTALFGLREGLLSKDTLI